MKKLLPFLVLIILAASCRETWTMGTKNRFYEGCTTEASKIDSNEQRVKDYCGCIFDKMKQKYEHEDDAIQHLGDLSLDPDLQSCHTILKPSN